MATKMITGVVERVLVRERENGADAFGNTHTRALQIGGQWYNFSGGTKPVWNVKIGDGFKVLGAGSEVAFKATTTVSKTNGKEYTNCSGLMVINLVEGDNSPPASKGGTAGASQGGGSSGNTYQAKPKDMSGISVGHSFNGAMNFLTTWGVEPSNENIIEYGKKVHNATEKLKAEYAKANPEMSSYDTGAAVGNSILNACKLVGTDVDFEEGIYNLANDFLANVVPEILKHVKGEVKQAPPAMVTRAPVKKPAATKAKPVEEAQPSANRTGFDDMDDDIPFANPMRLSAGLYLAI